MSEGAESTPRPGTGLDLSRRMDKLEINHADLAKEVGLLSGMVGRVELNQKHAEELNELRFKGLDTAIKNLDGTLKTFMGRIEGLITGEVKLPQNERLMQDWSDWRKEVDKDREAAGTFQTQGKLLGRIAVLLVTSNIIAIVAAIVAAVNAHPTP